MNGASGWTQVLESVAVALVALAMGALLVACGDDVDEEPGSATDPDDQPPIVLLDVSNGLAPQLGRYDARSEGAPIVQAVAGYDHVCALDEDGAAWCWGDPLLADEMGSEKTRYPTEPTRVVGAPAFTRLEVPVVFEDEAGQSTNMQAATCGLASDQQWWCWGDHVSNPLQDRTSMVDAVPAGTNIGSTVMVRQAAPQSILTEIDVAAGLAIPDGRNRLGQRAEVTCGLTGSGELLCWPGYFEGEDAVALASFEPGTQLSGGCLLTPDGAVGCYVPFGEGPVCDLGLTEFKANGARGCGVRTDGQWRCFGRPSDSVEFRGLIDVNMVKNCSG